MDLNDLIYYAKIVELRSFSKAGLALGVPKSTLSRRISLLEATLEVQLLQRSTTQIKTTEMGRIFYGHCVAIGVEAEAAREAIEVNRSEPRGIVKVACPVSLAHTLVGPIVARFMIDCPYATVNLIVTDRVVDLIEEGIDIALRVRTPPLLDEELVMKQLGNSQQVIVASPIVIEKNGLPQTPEDLSTFPALDLLRSDKEHQWFLHQANGPLKTVPFTPRLVTNDLMVLLQAAEAGVGAVQLPRFLVEKQILSGTLQLILPEYAINSGLLHAVFVSRKWLLPTVRAFLNFLGSEFEKIQLDNF